MFSNMGGKIKTLAMVGCWIGIISSAILGFITMASDEDLILAGLLTMALGSLFSWLSSFVLYGFGELVESSEITAGNTYAIYNLLAKNGHAAPRGPVSGASGTYQYTPPYAGNTSFTQPPAGSTSFTPPPANNTSFGDWICPKCDTKNSSSTQFCKGCGAYK